MAKRTRHSIEALEALQEGYDVAERAVEGLQRTRETLQEEINKKTFELVSLRNLVITTEANQQAQLLQLRTQLEAEQIKLAGATQAVAETTQRLEALQKQYDDQTASYTASTNQGIANLQKLQDQLTAETANLELKNQELERVNATLAATQASVATKEAELATSQSNLAETSRNLEAITNNYNRVSGELTQAQLNLNRVSRALQTETANFTRVTNELSTANAELTSLRASLATGNVDLQKLNDDLTKAGKDLEEANAGRVQVQSELDLKISELQASEASLRESQAEIAANTAKIARQEEDIKSKGERIITQTEKIAKQGKDIEILNATYEELSKAISNFAKNQSATLQNVLYEYFLHSSDFWKYFDAQKDATNMQGFVSTQPSLKELFESHTEIFATVAKTIFDNVKAVIFPIATPADINAESCLQVVSSIPGDSSLNALALYLFANDALAKLKLEQHFTYRPLPPAASGGAGEGTVAPALPPSPSASEVAADEALQEEDFAAAMADIEEEVGSGLAADEALQEEEDFAAAMAAIVPTQTRRKNNKRKTGVLNGDAKMAGKKILH